ncbi:hypothetical protein KR222_003617, partial [Zaprionus bogoriensis]
RAPGKRSKRSSQFQFFQLQCTAYLTFTNLKCSFVDKSFGEYRDCSIKAVNRTHKYIRIYAKILQKPLDDVTMNIQLMRNNHGFKPYLINITFDACKFLNNQRNPIVKLIYKQIKDRSNINHTCPYNVSAITAQKLFSFYIVLYFVKQHDIIIDKFWTGDIEVDFLKYIPIPNGEYAVYTTFYAKHREMCSVKTFIRIV